jgi:hypothetical protein
MGIVKLAFMTPATIRIAIPLDVPLMIAFLPLRFSGSNVEPGGVIR